MRFLVGGIMALFIAWAGYWFVGQRVIEGQIAEALGGDLPEGITVSQEGFDIAGFPSRFDLTVTQPRIYDALSGWGWNAAFAQVFSMTWKPWHLIAALPHSQNVDTPLGPLTLETAQFMASLRVAPNASAAIEEAVLEVETAQVSAVFLPKITAETMVFAFKREEGPGFAYRLGVQIGALTPLVAAPTGGNLAAGRLDAVIETTDALDRAMVQTRPQVTAIDLRALSLDWGAVLVTGDGKITADEAGFAEGEIALKVTGWRDLAARLADFGMLRAELAPTITRGLELIAERQGNPEVLDLPLQYDSGRAYLGPLPIGAAPLLVQRQ